MILDHDSALKLYYLRYLLMPTEREDVDMSDGEAGAENDPLSNVFDLPARPRHRMLARRARGFEDPAEDLTDENLVTVFARY